LIQKHKVKFKLRNKSSCIIYLFFFISFRIGLCNFGKFFSLFFLFFWNLFKFEFSFFVLLLFNKLSLCCFWFWIWFADSFDYFLFFLMFFIEKIDSKNTKHWFNETGCFSDFSWGVNSEGLFFAILFVSDKKWVLLILLFSVLCNESLFELYFSFSTMCFWEFGLPKPTSFESESEDRRIFAFEIFGKSTDKIVRIRFNHEIL